jgi:aryl carrier-like protein
MIFQLNGEKTTPTPIELTLRGSSTYISDAIVFGHGRSQIGALIVLADGAPEGLSDAEYYELIKPAVHAANAGAPSHSQLSPETLIYLPFSTPIPRADKGSFLRPKVYAAFKDVIVNVYKRLEGEDVDSNNERRRLVNVEEAVQVVTEVVRAAAGRADDARLGPMTDLFDYGLDSLQAGRIRNTLQRVSLACSSSFVVTPLTHFPQDLDLNGAKLSTNIVFDRPSIQR